MGQRRRVRDVRVRSAGRIHGLGQAEVEDLHGLSMLGDHEAFLGDVVKDGQALLLELGGGDLLHGHNVGRVT